MVTLSHSMSQMKGGPSRYKGLKIKILFLMNSITVESGKPNKAGNTDCEANGTCLKP